MIVKILQELFDILNFHNDSKLKFTLDLDLIQFRILISLAKEIFKKHEKNIKDIELKNEKKRIKLKEKKEQEERDGEIQEKDSEDESYSGTKSKIHSNTVSIKVDDRKTVHLTKSPSLEGDFV